MITLSARYVEDSIEFKNWALVERIIRKNMTQDMKSKWAMIGYDALFTVVPEYFGMTRMYRGKDTSLTFEFTDEQWFMFLLRWA